MTKHLNNKNTKLELLIDELITIINNELKSNPFEELEKAKKIVSQKNFNQYSSIEKKIKDLGIRIYNMRLVNTEKIIEKINQIILLLNA